jgi:hypothetical protein
MRTLASSHPRYGSWLPVVWGTSDRRKGWVCLVLYSLRLCQQIYGRESQCCEREIHQLHLSPTELCLADHSKALHVLLATQGVILYGEPGTGKTLLAKAVANSTSATFLRVVGSELIQK